MGKNAENNTSPIDEDPSASSPTGNLATPEQNVIDLLKNDVSNSKSGEHFRENETFTSFCSHLSRIKAEMQSQKKNVLICIHSLSFTWLSVIKLKCNK